MKLKHSLTIIAGAVCALLTPHLNANFEEASEYIDTDGTFVAYIDFKGDGEEIGTVLNSVYNEIVANTPEMIPIPIDFNQLFTNLGFGSIHSMAWGSKEIEPGLHRNTSVALMNGDSTGLFAIYGTEAYPFSAPSKAPTDASVAVTANIRLTEVRDTIATVVQQIMGPMGEGILQQQLTQTIPDTEITVNEVIEALSGKFDFFYSENYGESILESEPKLWLSIENAGHLLSRLESLGESGLPITFVEEATTLKAILEQPGSSKKLFFEAPKGSSELIIYTDADWTAESEGPRLVENPEFKTLASRLPEQGFFYMYSGKTDIEPLLEMLEMLPQTAKYKEAASMAIDLFIGGFLEPNMVAVTIQDGNYVSEQYAGYSTKQAFTTIPAAMMIGIGAGIAISALGKVRENSRNATVKNNLRYIGAAAQQYLLENDATEVSVDQLTDYIALPFESIAGESYDLTITAETEELSVTLEDGTVISIDL